MSIFHNLALGFSVAFVPINLLYCFIGVLLGTIVGVLPGLGAPGTMALLLPITYYVNPAGAIMLLAGIYYGCQYGGSTTAILLNIPGEAVSSVTCIDGYQMHKKGRGGAALGISAFGSFFAGTLGVVAVTFLAPTLVEWALQFGPAEYFGLAMMGVTLVSYLSSGSVTKGLIMAILGMLAATMGLDPMMGTPRFTFGSVYLTGGIDIIVLALGMFALNEVFRMIAEPPEAGEAIKPPSRFLELLPNRQEWKDSIKPILRGSIIGFLVGILPGGGGVLANVSSYVVEKKVSKHPERFGTGEIAGVAGPESANNGSSAGAFIPLMTLGIPSNVQGAILLGALMLHGITPGPMFMQNRPDVFWGVITSMYIGNVMLLILNLPLIGLFTKIAYVPFYVLTPIIAFITFVSVLLVNNNPYDILALVAVGVFSFVSKAHGFDAAPFIFGFILEPLVEFNFRQALVISKGHLSFFVSRPLPAILLTIALIILLSPVLSRLWRGYTKVS